MFSRIAVFFTLFFILAGIYFVGPWSATSSPPEILPASVAQTAAPSDKAANEAVRETMRRLADYSQSTDKILSGQSIGHAASDLFRSHYRTWSRLTQFRDQPAPAVMALDLGLNEIPDNASPILKLVKPHAELGGLVSISMHPGNPWTQGEYNDREHGRFEELFQPGHPTNVRWLRTLDAAAHVLKKLEQNKVTVLWRPLHEANGDWFWWCGGGSDAAVNPEQYKQLWRHMHEYLRVKHDLHNLIWVYAANVRTGPEVLSPLDFYPGDDVVDVVGLDYYGPNVEDLNNMGCYDEMLRTKKIVALSEFGSKPMDGSLDTKAWVKTMREQYPRLAYFVFWHSWPKNLVSLSDLDDIESLMSDPWVHHLK